MYIIYIPIIHYTICIISSCFLFSFLISASQWEILYKWRFIAWKHIEVNGDFCSTPC